MNFVLADENQIYFCLYMPIVNGYRNINLENLSRPMLLCDYCLSRYITV